MREINTVLYDISSKEFEDLYAIKSYCESRKSCANCSIGKDNCEKLAKAVANASDISCMAIGKVKDSYCAFSVC